MPRDADSAGPRPGAAEVLVAFLRLGLTSFGGPVAHLGYFRTEFVERRRWLDERAYADLVALCQFLPGPASSQVGLGLGLQRAGYATDPTYANKIAAIATGPTLGKVLSAIGTTVAGPVGNAVGNAIGNALRR